MWLSDTDRAFAAAATRQLPGGRWLALAPGANWPGKVWPLEHHRVLLDELRTHFDAIIVLGDPGDKVATDTLAACSPLPVADLGGATNLRQAAAAMASATLFLGNDSGLGHLAAAVGTPTLTLFGPGEPERYHPWGSRAQWLVAPDADLSKLAPAAVAAKVREMLAPGGMRNGSTVQ